MSYPPSDPSSYPLPGPPQQGYPQQPVHQQPAPYGPPPPQRIHMQVEQPKTDGSKRFLNMSAGVLISLIIGVLLVCCVGPFVLCGFGGFLSGFQDATKSQAKVEITSCKIDNSAFKTAEITYRITNPGTTSGDYTVKFAVLDGSKSQVGDSTAFVFGLAGGASATKSETVFLDAAGGTTCVVSEVS